MSKDIVRAERAKEAGEVARLLSYVLILVASVGLFFAAAAIPASRFERLGAGAFPKIIFTVGALLALIAMIDAMRKISRSAYRNFFAEAMSWCRRRYLVFICLTTLAVYLAAIPLLGFSIASFLFILGIELVLMPYRPVPMLVAPITAIVFSFGLNWLFAEVFTVFLPRGGL